MFGIQTSVLIVAVFTAFVAYQFRVREKKKEMSHSELLKSYNDVYSPIMFLLREIKETSQGEEKQVLIDKMFSNFGLSSSKAHLIGSVHVLEVYFDLNELYRAYRHEADPNEEEFIKCFKEFEKLIDQEFWDAHDIIYKEHIRYKDHHFKRLKAMFIDLIGTLKFLSEIILSVVMIMWYVIAFDYFFKKEELFPEGTTLYVVSITIFVCLFYGSTFLYSYMFYKNTSNRHRRKKGS